MATDLNSSGSTDRNYNKVGKTRLDAVVSKNLVCSQGDAYFGKEIIPLHILADNPEVHYLEENGQNQTQ